MKKKRKEIIDLAWCKKKKICHLGQEQENKRTVWFTYHAAKEIVILI